MSRRDARDAPDQITSAAAGMVGRFIGWFWFTMIAALACAVSIAVGYVGVRYYAQGFGDPMTPPEERISAARTLRGYANELSTLASAINDRTGSQWDGPGQEETKTWIEEEFRPRLNDLRRRLSGSAIEHDAIVRLLAAADSVANLASQPQSEAHRRQMRDSVISAVGDAESAIVDLGVARYIPEPALLPQL